MDNDINCDHVKRRKILTLILLYFVLFAISVGVFKLNLNFYIFQDYSTEILESALPKSLVLTVRATDLVRTSIIALIIS